MVFPWMTVRGVAASAAGPPSMRQARAANREERETISEAGAGHAARLGRTVFLDWGLTGLSSDYLSLLGKLHPAVAIGGRSRRGSIADAYLIVSEIVSLCVV